jgi:hypothetical protein
MILRQATNRYPVLWLAAAGLAVLLGTGLLLHECRVQTRSVRSDPAGGAPQARSELTELRRPPASASSPSPTQSAWQKLQGRPNAALTRASLAELRAALSALSNDAALADIRQFLDSKTDATTGLGFKLGRDGKLEEAPTLRTFLLDEMATRDPSAAAEYAKLILQSKDSADEWAVALRNVARGDTTAESRALLQQKTEELLRYEPWQNQPSVGYLEAFDAAVYAGGTNLLPALSELVRRKDNPAVAHASFLALDRLVLNDPMATLGALRSAPDWMQGREETRANYFARADVRDPAQRQILEEYLSDPRITTAELNAFAGVFPNVNLMISRNLLTASPTPQAGSLADRDAEFLRIVQQWLADPRLARAQPSLSRTLLRLQEFVRQARSNP